jgi:hypothetical protein
MFVSSAKFASTRCKGPRSIDFIEVAYGERRCTEASSSLITRAAPKMTP